MRYPPIGFVPGPWTAHNGDPAKSSHAQAIDAYTAWLVAVQRAPVPAVIGHAMRSGVTHKLRTTLPHYTEAVGLGLLVTGAGSVSIGCSDDAWKSKITVEAGGTHTHDEAVWLWADLPVDSIASDTVWRALDATDQSSPHYVTLDLTITDDATLACRVWHWLAWALPRSQQAVMPA